MVDKEIFLRENSQEILSRGGVYYFNKFVKKRFNDYLLYNFNFLIEAGNSLKFLEFICLISINGGSFREE